MTAVWSNSGFLSKNGMSLEYACVGPDPSEAPTIILLHEGLGCATLWRDFPSKLADATGFGVFAYSRAGYGQSDAASLPWPLDYMTREARDALPEVLDAIGFNRGILAGHSDGATIAAIYAGTACDPRVRGIVMMAPHFFTEEMGLKEIEKAKAAYNSGELRERMSKYHKNPDSVFCGWSDSWLHPEFKAWNVSDVIGQIRVPMLAIQGRNDQYGTLRQIGELETRGTSNVDTLILGDCRHAPFLDRGEAVVAAIAEFCEKLELVKTTAPERT
ncbi:MAG: alpha/beta hydrolase [Roseovarius sp.]|nr:alpha/beta hydrolase [Roseovarius sp.]